MQETRAHVLAVGDIMMHDSVKYAAAKVVRARNGADAPPFQGYGALFAAVATEFRAADLVFGNLETPIAPDHDKGTDVMVFNAPAILPNALANAGFDVVSFANNHVFDQGLDGFVETIERLRASPLRMVGAGMDCAEAMQPEIIDINGIRVAFIAGTRLYNRHLIARAGRGCSHHIADEHSVIAAAAKAREAGAVFVMLSIHWGNEYSITPTQYDRALAVAMLDGGVDAILGHHPHVLQPIERHTTPDGRHTFVAYSLGNFISGQGLQYRHGRDHPHVGNTRDGGLLRFTLVQRETADGPLRVDVEDLQLDPLWVVRASDHNPPQFPVVTRRELERLRSEYSESTDPSAEHAIAQEIDFYEDRRAHIASIIGDEWLVPVEATQATSISAGASARSAY